MGGFPNSEGTRRFIADHFRKRKIPVLEEAILELLRAPRTREDVYWSVLALRDVGTRRCVPALKALVNYPMQDVKDCTLLTLAHLVGAAETEFYVEVLQTKGTRKGYPLWAIEVAADHRAMPAVLAYVTAALKKKDPGDDYLQGIRYLLRIAPEVEKVLGLLLAAWPRLPEGHREALRKALPERVP